MKKDDIRIITITAISMWALLCIFVTSDANAKDINCNRHKIYCKIKELKPKMTYKQAMHLSNLMYKSARTYKVKDVLRSVAIAMQETSLRSIDRKQTIIVFEKHCQDKPIIGIAGVVPKNLVKKIKEINKKIESGEIKPVCVETFKYVKGSTDIGIFQFHTLTIKRYGIDAVKLKNDLAYSVDQHFLLMSKKLKYCKHLGEDAWTCYHSRTLKFRTRYKEDVERYY